MAIKYLLVAVLASAVTVFALQNNQATSVRFLFWTMDGVSLATVILVPAIAGAIIVGLPLWLDRWRLRSRIRSLEARVSDLEAALARERAQPAAAPPPRLPEDDRTI